MLGTTSGSNSPVFQVAPGGTANPTFNYGNSTNQTASPIHWQPAELPDACEFVYISCGSGFIGCAMSYLTNPPAYTAPFKMGDTEPIKFYVKDNRLFGDVDVPAPNFGTVRIRGDRVSQMPVSWDLNHNPNAIEIVNESKTPVFQLYYERPDHVMVMGTISSSGHANLFINQYGTWPRGLPNGPALDAICKSLGIDAAKMGLKPIFKYPSWKYPGQFAEQ